MYKKSIRIQLSGRPSPLIAGSIMNNIKMPVVPENCKIKDEIKLAINSYKQFQLKILANDKFMKKANGDFTTFVNLVEEAVSEGQEISWAIGNGFTFYRAENEAYHFDRRCRHIASK